MPQFTVSPSTTHSASSCRCCWASGGLLQTDLDAEPDDMTLGITLAIEHI